MKIAVSVSLESALEHRFNYFVTDLCVLLLGWSDVAVPSSAGDLVVSARPTLRTVHPPRAQSRVAGLLCVGVVLGSHQVARQLIECLASHVYHPVTAVFKNNLNVVKLLLEKWGYAVAASPAPGLAEGYTPA